MSWSTNVETNIVTTEPLFYLVFTGKINGELNPNVIQLHAQNMAPEFYTNSTDANITLLLRNKKASSATYELYQNIPNPFNFTTRIGLVMLHEDRGILTISDLFGRTLKVYDRVWNSGYNEVMIDKTELNLSGVYYYSFSTKDFKSVRKMVLVK